MHDFKRYGPLILDAKTVLPLKGGNYPSFLCVLHGMHLFTGDPAVLFRGVLLNDGKATAHSVSIADVARLDD